MKHHNYRFLFLAILIAGVAFWPGKQARAQQSDTLLVKWSDDGINPVKDRLRDVIAADTNSDGSRAHKVYKLQAGGFYWITDVINNDGFPLKIVGETPDPNDQLKNPAVIQMVLRDDGTNPGGHIFAGQSSLTRIIHERGIKNGCKVLSCR